MRRIVIAKLFSLTLVGLYLVLGLTQPTVSHHLKKLTDAGLLRREQRGVWAYYSIEPETVARLRALVELGEGSRDERPAA